MGKSIKGTNSAVRAMLSMVIAALATTAGLTPAVEAQSVREVPTATRVAGTSQSGYNHDFGKAGTVDLSQPTYTVIDSSGNLYISDTGNNCVRKVDTAGNISVVAGLVQNSNPDTCNAASATPTAAQGLLAPTGLTVDGNNLYIADSGHNCVRELPGAVAGAIGTANLVPVVDTCTNTTTQSVSPNPTALILDASGNLGIAIADHTDNISQVLLHLPTDPSTTVCLVAGQPSALVGSYCPGIGGGNIGLSFPQGLAIDPVGNRFVADTGNKCIRELSTLGVVSTFLGQCTDDASGTPTTYANFDPRDLVFGAEGFVYISNADDTVLQFRGGSNPVSIYAGISYTGTQVPPPYTGTQEGIAAVDVSLNAPLGLSVDSTGNVYVADSNNGIIRQLALGSQFPKTQLHNSTTQTLQFEIDAPVNLSITTAADYPLFSGNSSCNGVLKPAAAGNAPVTCSVTLAFTPIAPGVRRSPFVLTDSSTNPATVYRFGTEGIGVGANALFIPGTISTVAASLSNPSAVAVSTAGDVYFAEKGATVDAGDVKEIPAGSQTPIVFVGTGNQVSTPVGLALDAAQNLYVADSSANSIYEVNSAGAINAVATGLNDPVAVVVDNNGNLLVAQNGAGAVELVKIYAGGQRQVIAGQGTVTAPNNVAASSAQFTQLSGLYLDANGVLYVSDEGALRVYSIDTGGTIHYFAGNGTTTTTDPTIATATALLAPAGITGDAAGDIYIADGTSNLVWVVFGGANQNPGIAPLVGTGTAGSTGDGGPANAAELNSPVGVGLDGADDLFVIDAGNSSLREVKYMDPTLSFGVVKVGQTGGPLSATLWDTGNFQLSPLSTFQPVDFTDFAQVADGCGGTGGGSGALQEGATCVLSFTFTPSATGSYATTASSSANALDIPQTIYLNGSTPLPPTLSAQNVTAVYGTAYTLAASVTGGSLGAPTGTIMFSIGGVAVCPVAPLPANGQATCSPSPTLENVGVYTVTVTYSGDGNYLPATTTFTLTITPAPVTITADNKSRPVNTPNPPLTATIAGVVAGQSILIPNPCCTTTAVLSSPVGVYPIVPVQPATAGPGTLLSNYTITYVNGTLTITNSGAGSASFTAPPVTAVYGTPYTLSAAVTGNQSTAPTGTVTFSIGGVALCPASTTPASATCSPSPTLENVGTYTVTVAYSGDSIYPAKSTTTTLTITPAPVTITANNESRGATQPNPNPYTGSITGVVAGQSITDTFSSPTAPASGTGTPGTSFPILPAQPATAGPGTLLTNYAITYVNGTLTITNNTGTTPTLNASPVTAVYGTAYTLSASVTGQTPAPTGTVTFSIGGAAICPSSTTPANATCSPSPTLENVGTYQVTITYSGDTNYATKTTTVALTVTPAPVTITADSFSRPVNGPNPVFTGIVSGVVAGQSITDTYSSPTAPASNAGPVGTYPILPTQPAVAGTGTLLTNYNITYVNGTLTVTQSSPGTTAASIAAPPVNTVYGTAYTLAATVSSGQAPAPTGTATFFVNGVALCPAQNLPANGAITCSPSPTLENAGAYTVTVTYSGDSTYKQAVQTLTLTIAPAPVTITANSFTHVVNTPNPAYTGTITGVVAGQSITATYATNPADPTAVGTYPIVPTAVAGANTLLSNYAITLVNGTLTITAAGPVGNFTLTATPPEQEIDKTGQVDYSITLTSANGFTDAVSLSCSGLPEGGTCSFAPGTVTPVAGSTNTIVMTVGATADATNVPDGSFGALHMPGNPGSQPPTAWLAWTMLPLGFGGGLTTLMASRKRRQRWMRMLGLPIALLMIGFGFTLGLTGCSAAVNYKIYTITVTATDTAHTTDVQSTTVKLTLAR